MLLKKNKEFRRRDREGETGTAREKEEEDRWRKDGERRSRRELHRALSSLPSSLKTHATLIPNFTLTNFPGIVTTVADNLIGDACAGLVVLYFRREQPPQTSNDNVFSSPASKTFSCTELLSFPPVPSVNPIFKGSCFTNARFESEKKKNKKNTAPC